MNVKLKVLFAAELHSRGFSPDGIGPHNTMGFADAYLDSVALLDLLDMMISRREKVYRDIDVVGEEAVKKSYADVVIVISAIRAVIIAYFPESQESQE